eukprot:tig00000203_g17142.t1
MAVLSLSIYTLQDETPRLVRPARRAHSPTLRACTQSVWLKPVIENNKARIIELPKRERDYDNAGKNYAIIGHEMEPKLTKYQEELVKQGYDRNELLYPDEIALRFNPESPEIAAVHRVFLPDGVGGRVSKNTGYSTKARHMREITLVLSGESLENALLVVSRQAAASRKRAAAAAAAEAAKKTREEAPAPAPPEDANAAANAAAAAKFAALLAQGDPAALAFLAAREADQAA